MKQQQLSPMQEQSQAIVLAITKSKSVGLAFALAILFGPIGLLYANVRNGLTMLIFAILSILASSSIGLFLVWTVCIAWAVTVVQKDNQKAVSDIMVKKGAAN
jgi:hypothetical protein